MSRLRTLVVLVLLAVAGLLVPATAASAATPLTANIVCDGSTGAITTWVSGTLLTPGTAPTLVAVEFQRSAGARVTATTYAPLSPLAQPFTVNATTNTSGDVTATGYTGTFDPVTSLYYRETVHVSFENAASGVSYGERTASCGYDQRTTVSLACDPAAATVTATVAGINGLAGGASETGRPTIVGYHEVTISQATQDSPRFTGQSIGPDPWDIRHRVTKAADGTWADTGYVHTSTSKPYYYAEELTVGVLDAYGVVIGGGTARCTLFDGSLT